MSWANCVNVVTTPHVVVFRASHHNQKALSLSEDAPCHRNDTRNNLNRINCDDVCQWIFSPWKSHDDEKGSFPA